ncbi:MAG: type I-U CRISPR-associated protein Cas8c [Planctomycetaceae bacterium]|nr:type I-U CRISPR-associated protein Cas8c [Planctomycetaceae bacterium]
MAESSIPVDLLNPGQVFACLGFLEASDLLLGNAEGAFDWSNEADIRFRLSAAGAINPFEIVLDHLANAEVTEIEPHGWPSTHDATAIVSETFPSPLGVHFSDKKWSRTKLPGRIVCGKERTTRSLDLFNWSDGSSRLDFKLYSGNRTGASIARDMLCGKRKKPNKRNPLGELESKGLRQLMEDNRNGVIRDPFNVLCELGGSFNMDPRGGWTSLDIGFSINEIATIRIVASPIVEILAVIGLENARPTEIRTRVVRYAVWRDMLSPMLARAALSAIDAGVECRSFRSNLDLSGKNKVVTFAEPESQ